MYAGRHPNDKSVVFRATVISVSSALLAAAITILCTHTPYLVIHVSQQCLVSAEPTLYLIIFSWNKLELYPRTLLGVPSRSDGFQKREAIVQIIRGLEAGLSNSLENAGPDDAVRLVVRELRTTTAPSLKQPPLLRGFWLCGINRHPCSQNHPNLVDYDASIKQD